MLRLQRGHGLKLVGDRQLTQVVQVMTIARFRILSRLAEEGLPRFGDRALHARPQKRPDQRQDMLLEQRAPQQAAESLK
jgi:hypothetical protein